MSSSKKKYLLAGVSSRAMGMFLRPMLKEYADVAEPVGLMDINRKRMEFVSRELGLDLPIFTDLGEGIAETKPDCVIVASKDAFHHELVIKALEAGCDAITEKPMTIGDEQCRAMLDAEEKSGKNIVVTFNCRYMPLLCRVKEELQKGTIGKVYSVDLNWYLDCIHGTSYFRRWHGEMHNSGGLLVHKATHHFDIVNWLVDDDPQEIFAHGTRNFFGPGKRDKHGDRCLTCKNRCEYYADIFQNQWTKGFYLEAESDGDHYVRDGCVFRDEVDIYDTMSAVVRYEHGTQLAYSLNAGMAYEGYRLALNGTEGRIEVETVPFGGPAKGWRFQITERFFQVRGYRTVMIPEAGGSHGGGDPRLRDDLFRGVTDDSLNRAAGSHAGAMSVLIGVAANKSIKTGEPIRIEDLLQGRKGR